MFQPTQPSVSASRQSENSLVGNKRNRNNHPIDTILLLLEANQYIGQHFVNLPQGKAAGKSNFNAKYDQTNTKIQTLQNRYQVI